MPSEFIFFGENGKKDEDIIARIRKRQVTFPKLNMPAWKTNGVMFRTNPFSQRLNRLRNKPDD